MVTPHELGLYDTLRIAKKAETYFKKALFSSDTRQSMKHRIIAKHLTEPK